MYTCTYVVYVWYMCMCTYVGIHIVQNTNRHLCVCKYFTPAYLRVSSCAFFYVHVPTRTYVHVFAGIHMFYAFYAFYALWVLFSVIGNVWTWRWSWQCECTTMYFCLCVYTCVCVPMCNRERKLHAGMWTCLSVCVMYLCVLCVLCVVDSFSAIGGPSWRYITANISQAWPSMTLVDHLLSFSSTYVYLFAPIRVHV